MSKHRAAPMPLWKIVLLWLAVGVGCVAWTYTDDAPSTPIANTYSA
ncbi:MULTISPECIES: hypothetical protein [unclassified Burkholderia]|nr:MULTISPECIES: hypothetical protein [unclassified Burkholderia]